MGEHHHLIQLGFNRWAKMTTQQKEAFERRNRAYLDQSEKWWKDNVKVERIDPYTGKTELINDPKRND